MGRPQKRETAGAETPRCFNDPSRGCMGCPGDPPRVGPCFRCMGPREFDARLASDATLLFDDVPPLVPEETVG